MSVPRGLEGGGEAGGAERHRGGVPHVRSVGFAYLGGTVKEKKEAPAHALAAWWFVVTSGDKNTGAASVVGASPSVETRNGAPS